MDSKKKTILILEDEPAMLHIVATRLAESGFETLLAKDGQEGLTLALQKHPDLILLDVLMPKIDGLTLMKKLREDAWGNTVPMIVLSNMSPDSNTTLQAITNNQPAYYFVKSDIKLEEIVEKIKDVLASPPKTE